MNKLLPQTKLNPRGFTLVELLVVIVILAILGVVGMAIFTGTQSRARDAKRKEDISAIAGAMEANYDPNSGYKTVVAGSWFSDGAPPANPGPGGAVYNTVTLTTAAFRFCATLENSTGNATTSTGGGAGATSGLYYCKNNAQ